MFWKKEKPQSEIITEEDELRLILDMQETKRQYEDLLAELREKHKELKEALYQARLIIKEMEQEIKNES